eukprot:353698-Chlamydomonas_euryale.AAC.6
MASTERLLQSHIFTHWSYPAVRRTESDAAPKQTELMTASCPLNLRTNNPLATSQRKTCGAVQSYSRVMQMLPIQCSLNRDKPII